MDSVQEKYFQLLTEIDDICRENNISYYLSCRTALSAYVNNEMNESWYNPSVMMTAAECRRFMKAVEEQNRSDRVLESMLTHGKYPHFTLKYTDTESLCFMIKQRDNYKVHGISIIINIIIYLPKGIKKKVGSVLRIGWHDNACPYARDGSLSKKAMLSKIALKPFIAVNRDAVGRFIFEYFMKIYSRTTRTPHMVLTTGGTRRLKESWLKADADYVSINGRKFPVLADCNGYLTALYGKGYRSKVNAGMPNNIYRIVDANISFEEFKKRNRAFFEDNKFSQTVKKNNKLNKENKVYNDAINEAWNLALAVGSKMQVKKQYTKEKKERLFSLYESGAYTELYSELKDYINSTVKAEKYRIRPYADKDLARLSEETLRVLGNNVLAGQMRKIQKVIK